MKEAWEEKLDKLANERFSVKMVLDLIKPLVKEIVEEERRKCTDVSTLEASEQDAGSAALIDEGQSDMLEEGEVLHPGSGEEFPGTSEEEV